MSGRFSLLIVIFAWSRYSGFGRLLGYEYSGATISANANSAFAASIQSDCAADINDNLTLDAADIDILFDNFGSGTTVSQGDINLTAPGDDLIDAADVAQCSPPWLETLLKFRNYLRTVPNPTALSQNHGI